MNWSTYQQAIFAFLSLAGNTLSLLIEAVAGSGKTTTIVHALSLLPRSASVIFLAFGKSIADTLASRVPSNVEARTFHSVGNGICRKRLGRYMKVKKEKTLYILWDMFPRIEGKQDKQLTIYGPMVRRLVDLARSEGIGCLLPDTAEQWQTLIDHHGLLLEHKEAATSRAIEIARQVLALCIEKAEKNRQIDFADMTYLPILWDLPFPSYDFVFVDEYQDTNPVRLEFVKRLRNPNGGRVVAVGDTHQAIMGFTGADARAMRDFGTMFPSETLPLSVSYRVSQAVARYAQQYVPHFTAYENAPEGKVEILDKWSVTDFLPSDAIICRNVKPLVSMAYAFIKASIPCHILGRDIGEGLVKLIQRLEPQGIDSLLEALDTYQQRESDRLTGKGREDLAASINDRCDSLRVLVDSLTESQRTLEGLVARIRSLFDDDKTEKLTLCTAHKSKGLEWQRVFILDKEKLMPSSYAKQEWQQEQERNLIYVACTRAKLELYFIASEGLQREPIAS